MFELLLFLSCYGEGENVWCSEIFFLNVKLSKALPIESKMLQNYKQLSFKVSKIFFAP